MDPGSQEIYRAFVFAKNADHITISGRGTINGNGQSPAFQLGDDSGPNGNVGRRMLMMMTGCRNVNIRDIRLENSTYGMQKYTACENLHIKGITVYNHVNFNNDGIDIDSKNVVIKDCIIDSDDDAICMKSDQVGRLCENVVMVLRPI